MIPFLTAQRYSREITKEQVIEIINEHIKNCLDEIK